MNPFVSIIISNYNYGRFLSEAIDSAINQTYVNKEVIVVDDGSTDNSRAVIASYGNLIVPVLKQNGGQASAFNAGFAASHGDIICMLDSDDIFFPNKLTQIVEIFTQHPDIDWCSHILKQIHTDIIGTNNSSLQKVKHESSKEYDFRNHIKKGRLPFNHAATSGLCFTRSLLKKILPMPEVITITSDNYLKFTASALSKGFFLDKELTLQRLHGNNAYSLRKDKQPLKARIRIITAVWLRKNFQITAKFANNLFALGLATYWCNGGVETEYKETVKCYFLSISSLEKSEIFLRAYYHWGKNKLLAKWLNLVQNN